MANPKEGAEANKGTQRGGVTRTLPAEVLASLPLDGRQRVVIENIWPVVDAGRYPIKRVVDDIVAVDADIFTDGHDLISAVIQYRKPGTSEWQRAPMEQGINDRWFGKFQVTEEGLWQYTVCAWPDAFKSWRRDLRKRADADALTEIDFLVGAKLIEAALVKATQDDARILREVVTFLRGKATFDKRAQYALTDKLAVIMSSYPDDNHATVAEPALRLECNRERARFSAWYEFFPRSCAKEPGQHGTFKDCIQRLEYVAEMGFDVVYLPPIHPVGVAYRKGKNNRLTAEPDDVGSPWAIGGAEGGHKSIHPALGSAAEFRKLVEEAKAYGMEIALDIAFQCSPDHPYVKEHPQWFRQRPDGSIQYAENPPKKYQDIYPFDFETEDWQAMWIELKSIFVHWINEGVRIFRVDNPHTKAFPFWEWCIAEIKAQYPDVLFLSEAFTRPKVMKRLAKLGFSQSYTYFAWRYSKWELSEYLTELTTTEMKEYFRANFWPNTPDILTEQLQHGGRGMFVARLLLAATLGCSYGIYGPAYELMEAAPREPKSEEYLDSEKYQLRTWDLERADSLKDTITLINWVRRENRAFQSDANLRFHTVDNDWIICFSKHPDNVAELVVVILSLDAYNAQSGYIDLPLGDWGIGDHQPYRVHDMLTDMRYTWQGRRNFVKLDPRVVPGHIFRIEKVA